MSNWEKSTLSLGKLKEGEKQIIRFKAKEELQPIISLSSSCGCTVPDYNKKTKEMTVSYTPTSVPEGKESYSSVKVIKITYKDGSQDVLKFTAIVTK